PVLMPTAPAPATAAAPGGGPVTDARGFPVAKDLLDEVMSAQAAGKRGATDAEIAAQMAAERSKEKKEATRAPPPAKLPAPANPPTPAKEEAKEAKESAAAQASIRVGVDVLEALMTLVSE